MSTRIQASRLDRAALAAGSTLECEELLRMLLAELSDLVQCQSLGFSCRESSGSVSFTVVVPGGARLDVKRVPMGMVPDEAREDGAAFCSPDNRSSPHPMLQWLGRRGLSFSACAPVVVGRQSVGWLVASRSTMQPFSSGELGIVSQAAREAGPALHCIHLQEQLEAAHRDLAAARDELMRLEGLTVQVELAHGVAHDINNILGLIGASTELLDFLPLTPEAKLSLDTIRKAVDDGITVMRRISRVAQSQHRLQLTQLDVNDVVRDALEMTRPRWQPSQATGSGSVRVRFDPGQGALVAGAPSELREVLVNLVINALDAMPEGGELTIKSLREDIWAVVSVTDTGCGMADEVRQRIFEPFFSTKGEANSGVGLWVSRSIVARHGGDIVVQSRPGEGSSFHVKLPLVASAVALPREGSRQERSILLVDDEVGLVEALKLGLETAGFPVVAFADARQALEAFRMSPFDIVITDLRMPDMTGWELADVIKSMSPGTPVVAMTGWPAHQVEEEHASRFEVILQKPCRVNDLKATVETVLANRKHAPPRE